MDSLVGLVKSTYLIQRIELIHFVYESRRNLLLLRHAGATFGKVEEFVLSSKGAGILRILIDYPPVTWYVLTGYNGN